jgi:hypothetical protein
MRWLSLAADRPGRHRSNRFARRLSSKTASLDMIAPKG